MYMAEIKIKNRCTYLIRESVRESVREPYPLGSKLTHATLFDLGPSPGKWINYPGGNAWYVDENLEAVLANASNSFDPDLLEELFWPWVRRDVRQAVEAFRSRSNTTKPRLTDTQRKNILAATHPFDKRRAHFLRFANMDQGPLTAMPAVVFKDLQEKSRDELEQKFMAQEKRLKTRDLKSYVYTIFDLQSFFQGFMARQMPHALDQERVDTCFLKEICRINKNLFGQGFLDRYMIRYLIMFFDHEYANTILLDDMERAFRFRHRSVRQPSPKAFSPRKARDIFKISKEELKRMSKPSLTKIYRKLARKHHPDRGGSHEQFVKINDAYQILAKKLKT
jgi:hypothetical protein